MVKCHAHLHIMSLILNYRLRIVKTYLNILRHPWIDPPDSHHDWHNIDVREWGLDTVSNFRQLGYLEAFCKHPILNLFFNLYISFTQDSTHTIPQLLLGYLKCNIHVFKNIQNVQQTLLFRNYFSENIHLNLQKNREQLRRAVSLIYNNPHMPALKHALIKWFYGVRTAILTAKIR